MCMSSDFNKIMCTLLIRVFLSIGALCVVSNLNGQLLFGEKLNVFSPDFWEVHPAGPIVPRLADDSPSIVEYAENRFNRFSSSGMAPHKVRSIGQLSLID